MNARAIECRRRNIWGDTLFFSMRQMVALTCVSIFHTQKPLKDRLAPMTDILRARGDPLAFAHVNLTFHTPCRSPTDDLLFAGCFVLGARRRHLHGTLPCPSLLLALDSDSQFSRRWPFQCWCFAFFAACCIFKPFTTREVALLLEQHALSERWFPWVGV